MTISGDILAGCRRQERGAQEALYRLCYPALMRIALRYTGRQDEAADVLNRAMFKVFTRLEGFSGDATQWPAWIRTILVREALDALRTRPEPVQPLSAWEPPLPAPGNPEDPEYILRLLERLPRLTASVFNLYAMEGYSHREIGEWLGISEANSKWHLHAARQKLQAWINQSQRA